MTTGAEHDVSKLPKWAQSEMQRLEANLRRAEKRMVEMVGGKPDHFSNVLLPYYRGDMHDQYLPKDQLVHFLLPHPWAESRPGHIGVRHLRERDAIDIQGSQGINIEPTASNCCVITFKDRQQ